MTIKVKASLAFVDLPVPQKIVFGQNVITEETANAGVFPNLPHNVASLQTKNDELQVASADAESGDHEKVAIMHNIEKQWDTLFRDNANYVTTIANGDSAIILKGGFVPTKEQSNPAQNPVQPNNFKVTVDTQQGSFTAKSEALDNAKSYVYVSMPDGFSISFTDDQMNINAGGKIISVIVDTHRLVHFSAMPSGIKQNVIMYAVNNAGIGPATATQSVIPQ